MRKIYLVLIATALVLQACNNNNSYGGLEITYPYENSVFPYNITAPVLRWEDKGTTNNNFLVSMYSATVKGKEYKVANNYWRPPAEEWKKMQVSARGEELWFRINSKEGKNQYSDSVKVIISAEKLETPIFYRAVPLPFKFARENLKTVSWHLGTIDREEKPHSLLNNIPVCANCHSFSANGSTIAMDVDAKDDKGAYAITSMQRNISFADDSIITWSDTQDGKFTYGLLSRISPNGRYVVSTLKDCEIFIDRDNLEYSQLFFPFKGILMVYDRKEKLFYELEGANDTMLVQSNPVWSPDGKYIYFTSARAKHFEESGIMNGSVPRPEFAERYTKFEKAYRDRDSLIKFSIYRIPFNNGKGGKAEAVKGASNNGHSNYFPKISPDGKWLVYTRAESFMLLQKDSRMFMVPADGGTEREMNCNTANMNSWHSWSPDSHWLVFSTKAMGPYTQLFLTHIDENGNDSPPVYLENFSIDEHAANIPEFVNTEYDSKMKIDPAFLSEDEFLVRNGEIKMKKGDLAGAFVDFNKAIKAFPGLSEPYYKRGGLYYDKGQHQLALKDFNTAIDIEERPIYLQARGACYLALEDHKNAFSDLNRSIELDPISFRTYSYLGIAYTNTDKYDKAIEMFKRSVDLYRHDSYTYYYMALAFYYNKMPEKAVEKLNICINLHPEKFIEPLALELRARLLAGQAKYNDALRDTDAALALSPYDGSLHLLRANICKELGLDREAEASYKNAKQLGAEQ